MAAPDYITSQCVGFFCKTRTFRASDCNASNSNTLKRALSKQRQLQLKSKTQNNCSSLSIEEKDPLFGWLSHLFAEEAKGAEGTELAFEVWCLGDTDLFHLTKYSHKYYVSHATGSKHLGTLFKQ